MHVTQYVKLYHTEAKRPIHGGPTFNIYGDFSGCNIPSRYAGAFSKRLKAGNFELNRLALGSAQVVCVSVRGPGYYLCTVIDR